MLNNASFSYLTELKFQKSLGLDLVPHSLSLSLFHSQGAKKTSRIRSSSQSSVTKVLVLPASTGAAMILDDSSDTGEDAELPETERTVALYGDSPPHKKQRRGASCKHYKCPYMKEGDEELQRTRRCDLPEPILDSWDEKDKASMITYGEYMNSIYAYYKKSEVRHFFCW